MAWLLNHEIRSCWGISSPSQIETISEHLQRFTLSHSLPPTSIGGFTAVLEVTLRYSFLCFLFSLLFFSPWFSFAPLLPIPLLQSFNKWVIYDVSLKTTRNRPTISFDKHFSVYYEFGRMPQIKMYWMPQHTRPVMVSFYFVFILLSVLPFLSCVC